MKKALCNWLIAGAMVVAIAMMMMGAPCPADEPRASDLPADVFAPPRQRVGPAWEPIEPTTDDTWLDFITAQDGVGLLRGWWSDEPPRILIAGR